MEVSGTVLRNITCPSFSMHVSSRRGGGGGCVSVPVRLRKKAVVRCCCGFSDSGHVRYYGDEKKKKEEKGTAVLSTKKKLKMLKKRVLFDDLQGNLTSDAAEVLMKQLEQVRAEEKELKRKRKQEKEAKLKASKMNTNPDWESSSSSSESESSESECDNEVVDMKKNMKVGVAVADSPPKAETMIYTPPLLPEDVSANDHHHKAMELFSRNNDISVGSINGSLKNENTTVITTESIPQKRIEVCMGNKCKKSGSIALLQEFERVVSAEGGADAAAVVGCKCMGKCKSAPNVRIQNSTADKIAEGFNDSVKVPANPLFVGVALEDVETIVARFLGENHESTNE
ncbi:diacylglycerol O-acyltransferase 3-1-like [Arachis stenosperma]|uniref:diacylglycerol O-acyltransferase 3-1-like n=1 Tax=Arachis stenosperma TaxID=217475 RepID=UPI0025AD3E9C|nr:diacylglycerol O-acyltransferase 3-1-like [Arachis stenosperma]